MYYVYKLLDYKGFPFYIGITKNLKARIQEHTRHKNATSAKVYRVRKCIAEHGELKYSFVECDSIDSARQLEKKWITQFKLQLVNKTHGKVKRESKQRRTKGRPKQCPKCLNWYRRINSHKCKE